MASIGTYLRREREKRKVSLSDISAETKIGMKYLKAIEQEDWSVFPGETYTIGFIRNYAALLELDVSEVISMYKSLSRKSVQTTSLTASDNTVPSVAPGGRKRSASTGKHSVHEHDESSVPSVHDELLAASQVRVSPVDVHSGDVLPKAPSSLSSFTLKPLYVYIFAGILLAILIPVIISMIPRNSAPENNEALITTSTKIIKLFPGTVQHFDMDINHEYRCELYKNIAYAAQVYVAKPELLPDASALSNAAVDEQSIRALLLFGSNVRSQMQLHQRIELDIDLNESKDIAVTLNSLNMEQANITFEKLSGLSAITQALMTASGTNAGSSDTAETIGGFPASWVKDADEQREIVFTATVKDTSYIKAYVDGQELEGDIYYRNGEPIQYTAYKAIQIRAGNAGAIQAKINGVKERLGRRDEVINKIISWQPDPNDETRHIITIRNAQ